MRFVTENQLRLNLEISSDKLDSHAKDYLSPFINSGRSDENGYDTDFIEEDDISKKNEQQETPIIYSDDEEVFNQPDYEPEKDDISIHNGNKNDEPDTDFLEEDDISEKNTQREIPIIYSDDEEVFKQPDYEPEKEQKLFSFRPAIESENVERWYDNEGSIGKIYVIPPDAELSDNKDNPSKNVAFSIPLQNNLQFEQMSRAATWNAINFFGRIGNVQQYSKTGNMEAITLTTKYFVDYNEKNMDLNTIKSNFTIQRLQEIEMMYRSLVLPATDSAKYLYSSDNDSDSGKYYYFTRPPLVNIVLGNPNFIDSNQSGLEDTKVIENRLKPYHNLFTDIYTIPDENNGSGFNNKIFYKNFVVTNVSIDKNMNDYNYYVEDNDGETQDVNYYDTTGFTVTLTVIEIDENYLGSLPSFNNYEYTLKSRGAIN